MEDGVGVVAVETELEEVAGCEGGLDGPELDVEVAVSGFEDYFGTGEVSLVLGGESREGIYLVWGSRL